MKLIEYMQNADDTTIYHIGCLSGFWFIGTKEEFMNNVDDISNKRYSSVERSVRRDEASIRNLDKRNDLMMYPYLIAERSRMKALIKERKKYLKEFVPYKDREVKEEYDRKIENDGHVVLVEGSEVGRYWWYDEVKNGIQISNDVPEDSLVEI